MYDYGIIGNCQVSALISKQGSMDWLCLPRPDSAPVFGRLLDPTGGQFAILPEGPFQSAQNYITHTNILSTEILTETGAKFRIVDFCPRYYVDGKISHPLSFVRIVEPISGAARIRVSCHPIDGWSKRIVHPIEEPSQLIWTLASGRLHMRSNASLTSLRHDVSMPLEEKLYFALTWDQSLEGDVDAILEEQLAQTKKYWMTWVKHCSIPPFYQEETIRSGLALKLHCYQDTGAILAATSTSLPEEIGGVRNWDYRFCWLRDAYFVLNALRKLGHFEEMEGFVKFLFRLVEEKEFEAHGLKPVYALDGSLPDNETICEGWEGYRGSAPVRYNNQAASHIQNDVYGEMVLTLSPLFLDARFRQLADREHERLLEHLVRMCAQRISQPDAGLWEFRHGWQEHSFSNLMCWAGLERAERIQGAGLLAFSNVDIAERKIFAASALDRAVRAGSLRNGPDDESYDASLLLMSILRYPDRPLCEATVNAVMKQLRCPPSAAMPDFLYRYRRPDDFGQPQSAFVICTFWLVHALARLGRYPLAHELMKSALRSSNHLGLLSEHFDPIAGVQSGNFPQAYSHVGLINAAFAVSPSWEEVL